MALYVEPINTLSITDNSILQRDLNNLSPDLSLNLSTTLSSTENAYSAYIAKFNGHALAVLVIRVETQLESVFIEHLIVRESTKRRGVGLFLLTEALNLHQDKFDWQWILTFSQYPNLLLSERASDCQSLTDMTQTYTLFFDAVKATYPHLLDATITIKS